MTWNWVTALMALEVLIHLIPVLTWTLLVAKRLLTS